MEVFTSDNVGNRVPAGVPSWTPTFESSLPIASGSDATPVVPGKRYVLCNPGVRTVWVAFGPVINIPALTPDMVVYAVSARSYAVIEVPQGALRMFTYLAVSQLAAIPI
jgi:hypothetical protein